MAARTRASGGFTLVEILVPILIVVLAVVGLLTSFVMGRVHTALARHRILALNVLRARIEDLKSKGYTYLNKFDPNPAVETGVLLDTGQDEGSPHDDLTCTRTTQISDNDGDGALEIAVGVTWNERLSSGNQTLSETLYTVVAPTKVRNR
jgi:type II secretory pathway pseudopilin PulG